MKTALLKDAFREIRKSFGRFLALFMIVMLGVSFFAGVGASPYDMQYTLDAYFDTNRLQDLRLVSTIGFNEEDLDAIREEDGLSGVYGSVQQDFLAVFEESGKESVVRAESIPVSTDEENPDYLNRFRLAEGRLPENENECLVRMSAAKKQPVHIGDRLTLKTGTDEEIDEVLTVSEVTVVGLVYTPASISFTLGSSTIGNGSVSYLVYLPENAFKSAYYTSVYVSCTGADSFNTFSDAYFDYLEPVKDALEQAGEKRIAARKEEIQETVREKVTEAVTEEVEKQVRAEVEKQVEEEIRSRTEEAVAEAVRTEIESQVRQAVEAEVKNQIAAKVRPEVESAVKAGLQESVRAEVTSQAQAAVQQAVRQELSGRVENNLTAGITVLQAAGLINADTASLLLESSAYSRESVVNQVTDLQMSLPSVQLRIQQETEKAVQENYDAAYESAVQNLLPGLVEQNYEAAFQAACSQYLESYVEAAYPDALQKAMDENYSAAYEAAFPDAFQKAMDENFESAVEENLQPAIDEVLPDAIETAYQEQLKETLDEASDWCWYVLDRTQTQSYMEVKSAIDTMKTISTLFPIFFIFVAALVCFTTMTRMVDEQRQTIGTFKALGYQTHHILLKYILYALLASVLGGVCGCILGMKLYPAVIYNAWGIAYQMPDLQQADTRLLCILSVAVMTTAVLAAALFACGRDLREEPVSLMRPKAPKLGKKVWLEHIPFLWKRFSFTWKVTVRNIFRYKKRFYMTLAGVAGCTALLVVGFGISDSIKGLATTQYQDLFRYNVTVTLESGITDEAREEAARKIKDSGALEDSIELFEGSGSVGTERVSVFGEDKTASVYVVEDQEALAPFIQIRDAKTCRSLTLEDGGVYLTKRLSELLSVREGDSLYLEVDDSKRKQVTVLGIVESYAGHYIYMTAASYRTIYGEVPGHNIMLGLSDLPEEEQEDLAESLMESETISNVSFKDASIKNINAMLSSLNMITMVMAAASGLLAFVVLYNLANVNISERIREIATIKVLGFYDGEVYSYVYREVAVITAFGAALGLPLGMLLHHVIMGAISMDTIYFGNRINWQSYVCSFLLTMLFSLVVSFFIHLKLTRVKMVESLKSVE